MKNEIVILGERSKWVPISSQRIQQVEEKNGNLLVDIMGRPGEVTHKITLQIKALGNNILT